MFQKYVGKLLAFFPTGSRLGAVGWKRFIFIIPKSCQYPPKNSPLSGALNKPPFEKKTCDNSNYGFIFLPKFSSQAQWKWPPNCWIPIYTLITTGVDCRAISYSQLSYDRKLDRFFSSLSGGGPGMWPAHIGSTRVFSRLDPRRFEQSLHSGTLLDYKWVIIPRSITPISKVITPISGA